MRVQTVMNLDKKEVIIMIKMLFVFLVVFSMIAGGISVFRKLTGMEKFSIIKLTAYSVLCGVLAIVALTTIVILF